MTEDKNLVDAFERGREDLLRAAEVVPHAERQTPFVGHWNLMDLLAHLVGWDYTNLQAIDDIQAGRVPDFYRHYDPGWVTYNQQLIDRHGTDGWLSLRRALRESQDAVVAALRALPPGALTKEVPRPGRRKAVSIAAILRAAIQDEREHTRQIEEFVTDGDARG